MSFKKEWQNLLFLMVLGLVLFVWKIGSTPILDGDTAFWAKIAKNILEGGDWLTLKYIHPETIIERGPLMPWLMAASFKLFGINELALSLWHSLLALGCVLLAYLIGKELMGKEGGFISALILTTSAQFFYQGRSPLQDIPLTFFITAALYCFMLFEKRGNYLFYYLSPVFVALAVLTKGPVGLALPALVILLYLISRRKFLEYMNLHLLGAFIVFCLVALPWYIAEYQVLGQPFLNALIGNNLGRFFAPVDLVGKTPVGQSIQPQYDFYSYFVQLLLLFVPWSAFLYPALYYNIKKRDLLPLCWAAGVILFFSLSLNYKISRYILPAFPALSLMVGRLWSDHLAGESQERLLKISNWINLLLIIPLLFLGTFYLIFSFPAEQIAYQPMILPLLAILSLGLLVSSILLFLKRYRDSLLSFMLSALLAYLILIPLTDIFFKEANPTRYLSRRLNLVARPSDRIIKYKGFEDHLMIFYLDHPMLTVEKRSELVKYLRGGRAYVVCEDLKAVENLGFPVKILERKNNFVLFTNQ